MTFTPHRVPLLLFPVALALCVGAMPLTMDTSAQTRPTQPAAGGAPGGDVRAVPVQGQISMIIGAGPNLTASVGNQGVLLVDTGERDASEKVIATIRSLSPRPLQFIINTQFHENHTGGNEALAKFGNRATDGPNAQAVVLAHENVLTRMSGTSGQPSLRPVGAWPTDTYFTKRKELYFNGEAVQVYHLVGQTDGDSLVFFRKSDVISAGDVFNTTSFPVIDVAAGGTINGVIAGLNMIMDLAVPANNAEDGTIIVPGYGRLSDELDVAVYRDMVTIIRDRVQDAVQRKQTLAEVKADKRMTLEYEHRYAGKGNWTRDQFLEAIYNTLPKGK
jgi:glyoxylase-like metal-dependent hydrolase (beta-lactamase superfamily II)